MTLRTGNQIKAARALADLNQYQLAELAGVNINTIRAMEGCGSSVLVSKLDTILRVQRVLEAKGVEIIPENGGGLGVRLKDKAIQ